MQGRQTQEQGDYFPQARGRVPQDDARPKEDHLKFQPSANC